jgi:hypothetical protein
MAQKIEEQGRLKTVKDKPRLFEEVRDLRF